MQLIGILNCSATTKPVLSPNSTFYFLEKVRSFVKDYSKEKGYTFVLGSNDAGSVLYGEESKDITNDVLKAINDDYKSE